MNPIKWLSMTLVLLVMASCINSQRTISDSIGAGYVAVETLANQVADTELLDQSKKQEVKDNLQLAKDNLDIATDLYAVGSITESNRRLQMAVVLLQVVEEILRNVES